MAGTIVWQDFEAIARGAQERAALLDGQALAHYQAAVAGGKRDPLGDGGRIVLSADALPRASGLVVLDVDGVVTCKAGEVPALPPPLPWFERVRGGQPVAVEPIGTAGRAVVAVPAPGGSVAAALLPADWVRTRMLSDDLPQAGDAAWLFDAQRTVLAARGDTGAALPRADTMQAMQADSNSPCGPRRPAVHATPTRPLRCQAAGGWWWPPRREREHAAAVHELVLRLAELTGLLLVGLLTVVIGADVAFGQPLRRLSSAVRALAGRRRVRPG